eukprot:XP_011673474.1 PREDICTED: uncharacterized protein LOC105442745 [Strongylocentrotus purpuratus]
MGNWLGTKEMTEPPSDDTPSTRMSSVANVDFDDILKEIAKALYKNSDIDDLGKVLGFGSGEIGRKIAENDKQGGNYMGTLDLLRMWRSRQTYSTEKAALRSALLEAGFDNLADQYLSNFRPAESVKFTVQQTEDPSKNKGDNEAMPSDMMKLREQLKRRYRKKFGQIKTSPVDSESRTWLQHIYVRRSSLICETSDVGKSFDANASSSHVAAVGLFTLQNLRRLTFISMRLDDDFYTGMSAAASQSKVSGACLLYHLDES